MEAGGEVFAPFQQGVLSEFVVEGLVNFLQRSFAFPPGPFGIFGDARLPLQTFASRFRLVMNEEAKVILAKIGVILSVEKERVPHQIDDASLVEEGNCKKFLLTALDFHFSFCADPQPPLRLDKNFFGVFDSDLIIFRKTMNDVVIPVAEDLGEVETHFAAGFA